MDLEICQKIVEKVSFDIDENEEINRFNISQVVKWQLAKEDQVLLQQKQSIEAGSGKKPFKQKIPNAELEQNFQYRGGGVIFGPQPKDWSINVPKKIRKLALNNTILYKLQKKELLVLDSLKIESSKTKDFANKLINLNLGKKVLIVTDNNDSNLELSSRNLQNVKIIKSDGLNVYDLLNSNSVLIDKDAVEKILGRIK